MSHRKKGYGGNAPCILTLTVGGTFTTPHLISGVTRALGWVGLRDCGKILVLPGDKSKSAVSD